MYSLRSGDGSVTVHLSREELSLIPWAADVLADPCFAHQSSPGEPLVAAPVPGAVLSRVADFVRYRASHGFPSLERPARGDLARCLGADGAWYRGFIASAAASGGAAAVCALLRAADFLRIEDLMNLCALQLALTYAALRPHQRAALFGAADVDEAAAARAAHAWACEEPDLLGKL